MTCATVRQSNEKLITTLASSADRRAGEVNMQELANAAWALATVKQSDEKLFTVLARAVERRVGRSNPQDLANTAWAFATVMQLDQKLRQGRRSGRCESSKHRTSLTLHGHLQR